MQHTTWRWAMMKNLLMTISPRTQMWTWQSTMWRTRMKKKRKNLHLDQTTNRSNKPHQISHPYQQIPRKTKSISLMCRTRDHSIQLVHHWTEQLLTWLRTTPMMSNNSASNLTIPVWTNPTCHPHLVTPSTILPFLPLTTRLQTAWFAVSQCSSSTIILLR